MLKQKIELRFIYIVELIGKGTYSVYANQCRKRNPELAKKLDEYGDHEYNHAGLFREVYRESFGKELGAEGFWVWYGKCLAYINFLLPMKIKLWILEKIEIVAVKKLKKDLKSGKDTPILPVLEKILPDELKHTTIYSDHYAS